MGFMVMAPGSATPARKSKLGVDELPRFSLLSLSSRIHKDTLRTAIIVIVPCAVLATGTWGGLGPAFLLAATIVLLIAIGTLWRSLLLVISASDAGVAGAVSIASARRFVEDGDEKRRSLEAIHDLVDAHTLGKLDDVDYAAAMAQSREEAKAIIRGEDRVVAPFRRAAETLAEDYLRKNMGSRPTEERDRVRPGASPSSCSACATSNDEDAVFCKKCGVRLPRNSSC